MPTTRETRPTHVESMLLWLDGKAELERTWNGRLV